MIPEKHTFHIGANGFAVDGSGKVVIPECNIKATGYIEAAEKLDRFLSTREPDPDIELITPIEKIIS